MPIRTLRRRVLVVLLAVFAFFLFLAGRLAWVQFVQGDALQKKALAARSFAVPVQARRGDIVDRQGRPLALSMDLESVWANPAEVPSDEVDVEAEKLAPVLDLDEKWLETRLSASEAFVWLKHAMDDKTAAAVRALDLPGLHYTREAGRVYPEGTLAANVIGFSTVFHSYYGVEQYYDKQLAGKAGQINVQRDALGRDIPQTADNYVAPKDGLTLRLTLDSTIQYICERELDKAVLGASAKAGYIVALDPATGGILCMADRPTFDPNNYQDYPSANYRNRIISDTLSPGSTFKPVTASAALSTGVVTPDTPFYDSGAYKILGQTIHNWNGVGLGSTTFSVGFWKSANTIFARTAVMTGKSAFYDYLEKFGLTKPTGVDLPGEVQGIRPPESRATDLDLAIMGFGQTLTVTPMQLTTAIAAIANGGELMWPHVADAFLDSDGKVVQDIQPKPERRVITQQTASEIRVLMEKVVDEGTGQQAQIPCYSIGGKTGTTQKVVNGRVSSDAYIASFIGFAPAEHPEVVLYVAIDEPQGLIYGGQVAAPVFEAAMRDILRYLDVPPHCNAEEEAAQAPDAETLTVPSLVNLDLGSALTAARQAGFTAVVKGSGNRIERQTPPAGAQVPAGTTLIAYADGTTAGSEASPSQSVTVPDLTGQTIRDAARILATLGLKLDMDDDATGVALSQAPTAGTKVQSGATVHVTFGPPPPPTASEQPPGGSQ